MVHLPMQVHPSLWDRHLCRSRSAGSVWFFVFEAVLKSPATTAGHGGRDHCGRSSLLLAESCCESIPIGDGELVHRLDPLPG